MKLRIFFFFKRTLEENTNPSCNSKTMTRTELLWTFHETDSEATAAGSLQHGIHKPGRAGNIRGGAVDGLILYTSSFYYCLYTNCVKK